MTPREVIPAEISEEVEAEVSTALHKMVADERRYAGMAMNKRLLDGHEMFIADKIEALKDRACFRWDWYVEKLRAIVERRKVNPK